MPSDVPDSHDNTEVRSGDTRVWGELSDLIIVKETTIDTVSDEIMYFTPDGKPFVPAAPVDAGGSPGTPPAAGRRILRPARATINLDKALVTQTFMDADHPVPYNRIDEYNARSGIVAGDPGLNPAEMGAIGALKDVFRVSTARNFPPKAAIPEGIPGITDDDLTYSSYNDLFGSGPGLPSLKFGRLEIRISAHFYHRDRRSGPLYFDIVRWPEDGDLGLELPHPELSRGINLDYKEQESEFTSIKFGSEMPDALGHRIDPITGLAEIGMRGEILTGGLAFNHYYHAWGILSSLNRHANCRISNLDLIAATLLIPDAPERVPPGYTVDDRVKLFSVPKCPPATLALGIAASCEAAATTQYISCLEISVQKYQERWITITDRFNSLLNEIDRIFCILKASDINMIYAKFAITDQNTVITHLLDALKAASVISAAAIDPIILDNDKIDISEKVTFTCL